ncbi:site-specific integrase [Muribacter muris]|uniref:Site-specific integrase n=1 Tax=Muribacter muris TaxID=67855 RepID=A0A4Y9JSV7_9PAST|nr:site-specific integrase [Muribacter muris]MBF0786203.1 site-specific integrase [Muribacter muris]MBF0826464.1 site-specific integrase [Muribacter muris]TFV07566.1 site-specific integrase [Muribacter muris]
MATFTKRANGWRAQVRRKGISKSATFRTKAEATAWAHQLEMEINAGTYNNTPDLPFSYVIEKYLTEITPKKRSARHEMLRLTRLLEMPIAKVSLQDLTEKHFQQWRDQRLAEVSPASVHREWSTLGNMLNIAQHEWKLIGTNYLKGIRKPETPKPRSRRYTTGEINNLIYASGFSWNKPPETATARVGIAILFAIETAMRAGEIVNLTWEHIHTERRIAHLPQTKNGYARDVPLSTTALKLLEKLEEVADGESVFQLTSSNLDALFRKLKKRVMLDDLHFHDTRREALTRLAKKLSVMELAKMSGHRDLSILQNTYYAPDMSEVANKLD